LTFLIASFAVLAIGIETRGRILEQITGAIQAGAQTPDPAKVI
jgi:hypothetical protein